MSVPVHIDRCDDRTPSDRVFHPTCEGHYGIIMSCPVRGFMPSGTPNPHIKEKDSEVPDVAKSACPVSSSSNTKAYKNKKMYNVYSQEIDPKNQMPAIAKQEPTIEGQSRTLETGRVSSTIPKGYFSFPITFASAAALKCL